MEQIITSHNELRQRGFRALADTLGWVNAVRFMRDFDPGSGNYTDERAALLPDWSASRIMAEIERIQNESARGKGGG